MKKNRWKILVKIMLLGIYLAGIGYFLYHVFQLGIIPNKYLLIGLPTLALFTILMSWMLFNKKHLYLSIIAVFLLLSVGGSGVYSVRYLSKTNHFLSSLMSPKKVSLEYVLLVWKDSKFQNLENLDHQNVGYVEEENTNQSLEEIKKKSRASFLKKETYEDLLDAFKKKELDSILIEAGYLELLKNEIENFSQETRKVYHFEISIEEKVEKTEKNVREEPFILYISGIDQYGRISNIRSRSDVNMLAVVHPKKHQILLVNTPRDYYVQLAGTTGLKDKLTHAGIYGIDKSLKTMEQIYKIDISYYLRINFDTLIKIVDLIGGIDIYSEKSFTPWTNQSISIKKGMNHLNGAGALAFARERKAYVTGDHHRGENQQQVIRAIIDKLTTSDIFVSKYLSILNILEGTFQTNMDREQITAFIKTQIDQMPSWTVDSTAVTGRNAKNYTYSMGRNYLLYVMEPDWKSVRKATRRIEEVMGEKQ